MAVLSLMAAMDRNRVIGKNNRLPWHLSEDLKHFKTVTMGKPIIMGRRTFESIGRPLPGRRNIVISSNEQLQLDGCEVMQSLEDALDAVKDEPEAVIIGGMMIYRAALPIVDRMYLTELDAEFEGDAWFPGYDPDDWDVTEEQTHYHRGDDGVFEYRYLTMERKPGTRAL